MTQFKQDTGAIQDTEARGTLFGYRSPGIPGLPALLFCQHFTSTVNDHDPALSGAFTSDREVILFNDAEQRKRTATTRLNADDARCEALFASGPQQSDAPTAASLADAISGVVRRFGTRGLRGPDGARVRRPSPGSRRADALGPATHRQDGRPAAGQIRPQAARPVPRLVADRGVTYRDAERR
jgi:hypothetical protein